LEIATMSHEPCPAPLSVVIGVGFDTARYGHHVTFLDYDLQPVCAPTEFTESHAGYQRLDQLFRSVQQRFPAALFHIRLDVAGQYAANLEAFLRNLPFAKSISLGEPARNQNYRKAISPKRKADPVESHCAARFALREHPKPSAAVPQDIACLREIVARLEGQTRLSTRLTNQLHNLLARVFPELAVLVPNLQAAWTLSLLHAFPTPARIARAQRSSLTRIPHLTDDKAEKIQAAAALSVASLTGATAADLVLLLVKQLRDSLAAETRLKDSMAQAYKALPTANHLDSIPGIGEATAAVLTAKMVSCQRFPTPNHLVSYFGIFPEEESSGVDKDGQAKPGRQCHMSRQGNDLVRKYLWNAAKTAMVHNPAVKSLYQRLRARGKRGDVALGHCMRKLLHLVYAVWTTGRPFDPEHYPWANADDAPADKKTAGHNKQDIGPERKVVTAVPSTITPEPPAHNSAQPAPAATDTAAAGGGIDFAALRASVSMEQILTHLGCFNQLHGPGPQRRGRCPVHCSRESRQRSFSVHLGKKVFQCFHPPCSAKGNLLDLWAAVHRLPLYQAAVHLAQTFNVSLPLRNGTEKRNP
jgi:transposase